MEQTKLDQNNHRLRLLVVIASFGVKNIGHLKGIIATYRKMRFKVDIIVTSDAPKDLGAEVTVVVGVPDSNPWSLPFAHKSIFAARATDYDLFIYSEDDMGVTEENILAFIRVSGDLADDEIAGYLRYEVDEAAQWSFPEIHDSFHWKPETVKKRNQEVVAEFSNEHAGFYLLNQAQLKKVIMSGGFLRAPYRDRYNWPETAATDPYTSCGFRKVICVSELKSFCIHHLPNRYIGKYGLTFQNFKSQIQTLIDISNRGHPSSTLCEVESKLQRRKWSKSFYELPTAELLRAVPANAKTILSVGCGWGVTEAKLRQRGAAVTALPLDSVIGAEAATHGVEVIYETLEEGLRSLNSRKFDCILIANLLHLLPAQNQILQKLSSLSATNGTIVISGPNFEWFRILAKKMFNKEDIRKLNSYSESGIHAQSRASVILQLRNCGMNAVNAVWSNHSTARWTKIFPSWLKRYTAKEWIIQAGR